MMRKKTPSDQVKKELLAGQSKDLLQELHLLTRDGDLNADARRKLKQINHFAQFLQPAIEDLWSRQKAPLLVDVASGNAYLGFIVYEMFLKEKDAGNILSIETRQDLVDQCEDRAKRLGYQRMKFCCGKIEEMTFPRHAHLLTALHACDTATDEALVLGVLRRVDYLFLVPCCEAEISKLLPKGRNLAPSQSLYKRPLHRREFGALLTNVVRTLILRSCGYKVTVTELTSWEHTAKGQLLIAKRVQAYDDKARKELFELLDHFDVYPKIVEKLFQSEIEAVPQRLRIPN